MALAPGTRLGVYEILSPLGAGGMGEVYQAKDTRLKRDVALKVLHDNFAADPDRLARFQREAELLATLNHPNIAGIYGLEESNDVRALVLELVEGPTLADRIAKGPIPLDETLHIAHQIADALEAAHERGVIHRDLKPANIKVTPDGKVKVLDFGLAKMLEREAAGSSLTMSPTLSVHATEAGVILGTAGYMSPEQARGRPADRRADIWAFGCVLYEMLTGRATFARDTAADTVAAILERTPNWQALSPAAAPLTGVLQRCLEKDVKRRLRDIGDVKLLLEDTDLTRVPVTTTPLAAPLKRAWRTAAVVAMAMMATGAISGTLVWVAMRPVPSRVTRTAITSAGAAALAINGSDRDLALTPDGTHIVYVGNNGTQLFVRALDAIEPVAIASGAPRGPFVSPDGQWVGFVDGNSRLERVAITGGPPVTIARLDGIARGATWAPDETVIVATSNAATGLQRVSAAGGTPTTLTRPDHTHGEADHLWPEILPGGRGVLFTITAETGGLDAAQIAVWDLRTNTQKILLRGGSHAHFATSGHLVYTAAGTLRAIPFDLNRLETRGTAVPVVPRLVTTPQGAGDFALSTDGTLVYADAPAGNTGASRTLVWVDRVGHEQPIAAPPRAYVYPRVSPDGTRVAVYSADQEQDIWIWDLPRATLTRLTFEPGIDQNPVWTPDGRRIIFASDRGGGARNLWWQAADGSGAAERLTTSSNLQVPTGFTPDGTAVVFHENTPTSGPDLLQLALDSSHRVTPLLQTKFDERNGIVSPDGHWLAYESDSSGRLEICVRPFPNAGSGQSQVSTGGGVTPVWAPNGKELFYLGPDGVLWRAPGEANGATWSARTPAKLLEGRYFAPRGAYVGRTYDVSPDGRRFLMIKASDPAPTAAPSLVVVQHFDEELKRLAPATR
jgi:Tol biopolymer transport system component